MAIATATVARSTAPAGIGVAATAIRCSEIVGVGEWMTVSKDLEADHRHIWHAFHHLASAIAAEVARMDADIEIWKKMVLDEQVNHGRRLGDVESWLADCEDRLDALEGKGE